MFNDLSPVANPFRGLPALTRRRRPAWALPVLALLVLAAALVMAAACGGDEPEPTATQPSPTATPTMAPTPPPTPTPTVAPTPSPTATPTPPTAAPPTETAQPAASMRDFVIDASSTGKDLIDRLSKEEAACIRLAYGDAIFQFILDSPMLVQSGGDSAAAAPMFACIADENMAHLTAAFLTMLTGAESGESRKCFADVVMEHPGLAQASIGIELQGYETENMSRQEFRALYFGCLNDAETVRFFSHLWEGVRSANRLTGNDVLDVFTDSEVACFQDYSGDSYEEAFLNAPMNSGALGAHELHEACFGKDTSGRLFVTVMSTLLGGFTGETTACLADFGSEHEHYLDDMIFTTPERLGALSDEEVAELALDGSIWVECMTNEEYHRLWDLLIGTGAVGS